MKKILLLVIASVICISLMAQEEPGIYYNGKLVGYSRMMGKQVSNVVGAYFTLGLSSAKSKVPLEGSSAELQIEEKKPEFMIVYGEDKTTGYIFSTPKNINYLFLIKVKNKKSQRSINVGTYGIKKIKNGLDEKDIISFASEKIDENHIKIHPREDLEPGDYCFYYQGQAPSEESTFNGVFDFSIK